MDPRPAEIATQAPILGSVNLPFGSRAEVCELPASGQPVGLAIGLTRLDELHDVILSRNPIVWVEPRYGRSKPGRLWRVDPWFASQLATVPKPYRIVDLGAGHGREAIFAAAQGYEVEAVDHLPELSERSRFLASRYLDERRLAQIEFSRKTIQERAFQLTASEVAITIRVGAAVVGDAIDAAIENDSFPMAWIGVFFTEEHRERFGKRLSAADVWERLEQRLISMQNLVVEKRPRQTPRESVICCVIKPKKR